MDKKELRKKYKTLRKNLSEDTIEEWSLQIANQLIRLDIWQHSFYHLFLPIESQKEVNTEYILQVLAGKDKNIVLSKSDFSTREMTHFLLTFDEKGNRVGYGKGFYDKFLAECKPEILKIGVSFFEPENIIPDVLNTDIQLDLCITPTKVYNF